ncbi:hypothetical protein ING2E5A_2604 [Petrimonas mucosa]|uniref:Uncharacterized protein n=1 Tax=Petrimonas mucosa TaxID=1642646 RepID=A0A1G4GA20_9BACT|nr:hypothetical protein ING2E5A_2604 [Petrimonas mucosa]SFU51526.1 hypothetical protein SAMN05216364_101950 [Porphyromonadaceae bacterium KHP3R9]
MLLRKRRNIDTLQIRINSLTHKKRICFGRAVAKLSKKDSTPLKS